MFIRDQYYGNGFDYLNWPYQREMELTYFSGRVYEADLLLVLIFGA